LKKESQMASRLVFSRMAEKAGSKFFLKTHFLTNS
jgi:hypothetical protein